MGLFMDESLTRCMARASIRASDVLVIANHLRGRMIGVRSVPAARYITTSVWFAS